MKRVLKWTLIGLAAAGCLAAVQMARQAAGLPAVPQEVVTLYLTLSGTLKVI